MEAPQLSGVEKIYSDQLNRFLTFKNKMDVPAHYPSHEIVESLVQTTLQVPPTTTVYLHAEIPPQVPHTPVLAKIPSQVPVTPKPNFLTPPPTEGGRPRLKRNFFHNWVDSADCKGSDLAMTKPNYKIIILVPSVQSCFMPRHLRHMINQLNYGIEYLWLGKVVRYQQKVNTQISRVPQTVILAYLWYVSTRIIPPCHFKFIHKDISICYIIFRKGETMVILTTRSLSFAFLFLHRLLS
jgi:hypothetical protein